MRLLVGCPVYRRDWILLRWWQHIIAACEVADIKPHWIFIGDPADLETQRTIGVIDQFTNGTRQRCHRIWFEQDPLPPEIGTSGRRSWDLRARLEFMVELRNALLKEVRWLEPDLFWSVDSDILVHPEALVASLETLQVGRRDGIAAGFDAVAARTYMDPLQPVAPNYARITGQGTFHRPDWTGAGEVDVIMALKLMKPDAYFVDYRFHEWGEDAGWSEACRERGLRLGFDGRTYSRHVMSPDHLEMEDTRT